ncbi:MAG: DUF1653 domain-containing protein [Cytophagaceae bacterium]
MSKIKTGTYRHYKGKLYKVIGLAKHSESLEELVVYQCLYGEFDLWVRPLSMFEEKINADGKEMQRFEYVGE